MAILSKPMFVLSTPMACFYACNLYVCVCVWCVRCVCVCVCVCVCASVCVYAWVASLEFINGRAVRKFKISRERKGNLVDPASSHMLVSKTNSFSRCQNLWIWRTDSIFYFPCKEFINGQAVRKFKISKERKGNLVDPASSHMLVSKTDSFSRGQISGFASRTAIFTISRVKNLSTAGPRKNLRFRKKEKETWLILHACLKD